MLPNHTADDGCREYGRLLLWRAIGRFVDGKFEDIRPAVMPDDIKAEMSLMNFVEIQLGIKNAFTAVKRLADIVLQRDLQSRCLRGRVPPVNSAIHHKARDLWDTLTW